MLARIDSDVISAKPDWVLLSSGFGDTWNRAVDIEVSRKNIAAMLDKLQAAGIKVMILTPTSLEPIENGLNTQLADYTALLIKIAKERNLPVADLNAAFLSNLKAQPRGSIPPFLTSDNVHPNPAGSALIAQTIISALGATPDQMTKVENAWLDAPGGATVTGFCNFCVRHTTLSFAQYEKLKKVAADRKMAVFDLINAVYLASIRDGLRAHGDFTNTNPDDMSNQVDPIFTQKIEALVR